MNCRPGDLAIVVRDDDLRNVGVFVDVGSAATCPHCSLPSWKVDTIGRPFFFGPFGTASAVVIHDAALKPIRGDASGVREERVDELEVAA